MGRLAGRRLRAAPPAAATGLRKAPPSQPEADRKAKLEAGRVDAVFQVGDRVLLRTNELLDSADIGKLRPHFTVLARPSPSTCTLALPRHMRCSPTVDRLKPFSERVGARRRHRGPSPTRDRRASTRWSCCSAAAGCAESRATWCACGATSTDDEWLREEELLCCREKAAEFNAAAPRRRAGRRDAPPLPPAAAPPPHHREGGGRLLPPLRWWSISRRGGHGPRLTGGRTVLYYWVLYYWRLLVRGTVVLPRGPVRLSVDSLRLLDAASHEPAGRWVLLCPTCVALTNLTIIMV